MKRAINTGRVALRTHYILKLINSAREVCVGDKLNCQEMKTKTVENTVNFEGDNRLFRLQEVV
jgi:hypothetical protein